MLESLSKNKVNRLIYDLYRDNSKFNTSTIQLNFEQKWSKNKILTIQPRKRKKSGHDSISL